MVQPPLLPAETLARVLKRDGYSTLFLYGGRGLFDGMRSFAVRNGYERFIEEVEGKEPDVQAERASDTAAPGNEINATLTSSVDARRAKSGDEVTAALAEDTQAGGQFILRS